MLPTNTEVDFKRKEMNNPSKVCSQVIEVSYRNLNCSYFSPFTTKLLWLKVVAHSAVLHEDPGSNLVDKQQAKTAWVIPWSLADGRRQKSWGWSPILEKHFECYLLSAEIRAFLSEIFSSFKLLIVLYWSYVMFCCGIADFE